MNTRIIKNEQKRKEIEKKEKKRKKKIHGKIIKKIILVIFITFLICLLYARFIEPNMLFVNEYKLESKIIDNAYHGLKIIHFSDLHYGSTITSKNIDKIIDKINELKPDLVFFTGDLIEQNYNVSNKDIEILTKSLKKINTNLGKYAIIGNHDYYEKSFKNILNNAEFKILNNDYDLIYYKSNIPISVYGIDDYLYGTPSLEKYNDNEFLSSSYKILLLHEGDYIEKIKDNSFYNFDLILGGHSHNMQVNIPFVKSFFLPDGCQNYYGSYYKVNNSDTYISNGIGTSTLKLRFLNPPSINFYRIQKIDS